MKISTITVCHNSQASIARTVESFLCQSHADKELLVIDGASTDRTVDIVRGFGSASVRIISEKDQGIYDAMNKGLRNFSGDAIGFLNSDDIYHDDSVLSRISTSLEQHQTVYGDLVMISDHATRKVVRNWKAGNFVPGAFRRGWMPPHPTFYIRREVVQRVGLFDLSYSISADYDFMLRALELHTSDAHYIPHTLVDFMVGGVSTTGFGAVWRGNVECLRARRKHLGTPPIDFAFMAKPLGKLAQIVWRSGS